MTPGPQLKMLGVAFSERVTPLTPEEIAIYTAFRAPRGFVEVMDTIAYDLEEGCVWRSPVLPLGAVSTRFQTAMEPSRLLQWVSRLEALATANHLEFTFCLAPGFHVYGPHECDRYRRQFEALDAALPPTWALKCLEFYEAYWFYAFLRMFQVAAGHGAVFAEWV